MLTDDLICKFKKVYEHNMDASIAFYVTGEIAIYEDQEMDVWHLFVNESEANGFLDKRKIELTVENVIQEVGRNNCKEFMEIMSQKTGHFTYTFGEKENE